MIWLIVAAHPDDEVLGAGATMYKLTQTGYEVNVCILSGNAEARRRRPAVEKLHADLNDAVELLGVNQIIKGEFPNIAFNTVPHLDIVQFIENAIITTGADTIVTHHPADLNNDHYHTSIACQAAARLFQRRADAPPLKELLLMEVPSATDWSQNIALRAFNPNVFIEVGKESVDKKIEALNCYQGVMRDYPHPRCQETITGLAAYRGSQAGVKYAEAFESVFRRMQVCGGDQI